MTTRPAARPDRSLEMDAFLARSGWPQAVRRVLAGDASFRRYERVQYENTIAVLMDAPPPWEDVRPFVTVTQQLAAFGLSVPGILAADETAGFLLLEDLGDHLFTRLLKEEPDREEELYLAAIDALLAIRLASQQAGETLQQALPLYDEAVYLREAGLFAEWFLPQILGIEKARILRDEYLALWRQVLSAVPLAQSVLVHRDYHADNLLWLSERDGHRAVGMIDYQDALLGDAAYDVVSLLEDARRDVSAETAARARAHYVRLAGEDEASFALRYAVLAAQRNAKIIGIFSRLTVRDGKPHYLAYLPRVWGHFLRDLTHPVLAPIRIFVEKHVPQDYRGMFAADMSVGGIVL